MLLRDGVIIVFYLGILFSEVSCKKRGKHKKRKNLDKLSTAHPTARSLNTTWLIEQNRALFNGIHREYEIVFPRQLRKGKETDINTRDSRNGPKAHFQHVAIVLDIEGTKQKLKLSRNKNLISEKFMQKHYLSKHIQQISQTVDHCYYHGEFKKLPGSSAAVSTCDGVSGVIHINDKTYIIQPLKSSEKQTSQPHVLFKATASRDKICGNQSGQWQSYQHLYPREFVQKRKLMKFREKRDVMEEVKYLEMALVFDYSMFLQKNLSLETVTTYASQVSNIVDMYYKQVNTRVALSFVEIWNEGDQFTVSPNARETLHSFMTFKDVRLKNIRHDVAHFVTARTFENNQAGMAVPDSVCSSRAVAVNEDPNPYEPHQLAAVLSHMIGHNLGLNHDNDPSHCSCDRSLGCLMAENIFNEGEAPRSFSSCSEESYKMALGTGLGVCLFNEPDETSSYPQYCGNTYLERGEECDCGPTAVCQDPCCDPHTCLLKPWARCTTGPCCKNCTALPTQHMCREAMSPCDVPEFCDGLTGECPVNVFVQDGQPCSEGQGYCYQGRCPTLDDQCKAVWGQDSIASDMQCFERFNPTGSLNGHCGKNQTTGHYKHCADSDVTCGLLHCSGGEMTPLEGADRLTFSRTMVSTAGVKFECKIATGQISSDVTEVGLVLGGTRCGPRHMCLNQQCIEASSFFSDETCPKDEFNITCSGHGICTTARTCFCDALWEGIRCNLKRNLTTTTVHSTEMTTSTPTVSVTTAIDSTKNISAIVETASLGGLSTTWLIIILAGGVGVIVVILAFIMLCYRRRSPVRSNGLYKAGLFNKIKKPPSKEESSDDGTNRIIKFGSMPSYREDKRQERKGKKAKVITGSEDEQTRESNDTQTTVKIPEDLSKIPERGILKNGPRHYEESDEGGSDQEIQDGSFSDPDGVDMIKDYNSRHSDSVERIIGQRDVEHRDYTPYSSREELSESNMSDVPRAKSPGKHTRQSSRESSADIANKSKIVKLRNLDDLMRKIDAQVLPKDTVSPANSEEMKYSETEVDHHYGGDKAHYKGDNTQIFVNSDTMDSANESGIDTGFDQNTLNSVSIDDIPIEDMKSPYLSSNIELTSSGENIALSSFKPFSRSPNEHAVTPPNYNHQYHPYRDYSGSDNMRIQRPSPPKYSDAFHFKPVSRPIDGNAELPGFYASKARSNFQPPRNKRGKHVAQNEHHQVPARPTTLPEDEFPPFDSSYYRQPSPDPDSPRSPNGGKQNHFDSLKIVRNRQRRSDTPPRDTSDSNEHRNSYIMATDGAVEV